MFSNSSQWRQMLPQMMGGNLPGGSIIHGNQPNLDVLALIKLLAYDWDKNISWKEWIMMEPNVSSYQNELSRQMQQQSFDYLEAAVPAVWSDPTCFITSSAESFDRSRKRITLTQTPRQICFIHQKRWLNKSTSLREMRKRGVRGTHFLFLKIGRRPRRIYCSSHLNPPIQNLTVW